MRPTRRLLLAAAVAAPLGAAGSVRARAWTTYTPVSGILALDLAGQGESLEFRIRNVSGAPILLHSPFDHSVPVVARMRMRRQPEGDAVTHGYGGGEDWVSTGAMESTFYTEASTRRALRPLAPGEALSKSVALKTLLYFAAVPTDLRPDRRYSLEFEIDPVFARDDGELRWAAARAPQACVTVPGSEWVVSVGGGAGA